MGERWIHRKRGNEEGGREEWILELICAKYLVHRMIHRMIDFLVPPPPPLPHLVSKGEVTRSALHHPTLYITHHDTHPPLLTPLPAPPRRTLTRACLKCARARIV